MTQYPVLEAGHDNQIVYVKWGTGKISKYHAMWLRDSCQCHEHFHPLTKQRLQDTFSIPDDVHPETVRVQGDGIEIVWAHDRHSAIYPVEWLYLHSYDPVLIDHKEESIARKLWVPQDFESAEAPVVDYDDVMHDDLGVAQWTKKIYEYGFCMVSGIPATAEATKALIERISHIKHTHYGGFWEFTADLAKNDTAYTNLYLPPHTDGTYWSHAPGLQLLHCLHHDGTGGENILVDGFAAAKAFKSKYPESYELLSCIRIPAHSAGEENVCIVPDVARPIFTHHPVTGELLQVTWNNDDRSTMDKWSDVHLIPKFYTAIKRWRALLREQEFTNALVPGRAVIFDNWRVLHGRNAFTGARTLCGAYIDRDDYLSRMRLLNYGRENVLRTL